MRRSSALDLCDCCIFWRFLLRTENWELLSDSNSPCAAAIPAPGAPMRTAARSRWLPGSSASPANTSLFPDTRGPDCSAENGAAHSVWHPLPVAATESLDRNCPARSCTRQCHCMDCQSPDRSQWLAGTLRWHPGACLENDRSSQETCALRRWDAG